MIDQAAAADPESIDRSGGSLSSELSESKALHQLRSRFFVQYCEVSRMLFLS